MRLIALLIVGLSAPLVSNVARAQGEPPSGEEPKDPVPGDDTPEPWVEPKPKLEVPEPPPEPTPLPPPPPPPRFIAPVPPTVHFPPPPPPEDVDDAVPHSAHLMVRMSGGPTARYLFGALMMGGEGELGAGVDSPFGSFALAASFFGGTLDNSFTALHGVMGFYAAWPIGDVVRIGFEPRIGVIDIDRLTTIRQFGAYSAGVSALFSVDLVREDGYTFALGAKPTLDALLPLNSDGIGQDSPATLFGANAFVEFRWRSAD
ncbi:MAG: hypothetical protein HOV80_02375 [Polyangiaceae bacterium]|nr:hypothetical protein [Polyangiaceae bacterium]